MVKLVAQHLNQNEAAVRDTMAGLYFPSIKEQLSNKLLGEGGPIQPAMLDTARFLVELGDLKQSEVPASFKPFVNTELHENARGSDDRRLTDARALASALDPFLLVCDAATVSSV